MKIPMRCFFPRKTGPWGELDVLINEKPADMAAKPYWETEVRALRARHDELRDVTAFILISPEEKK